MAVPRELTTLFGKVAMGRTFMDSLMAVTSGALDGFLLAKDMDIIFLLKNIGIPVAKLFMPGIPDGLSIHSTGQLGLIATLMLMKR